MSTNNANFKGENGDLYAHFCQKSEKKKIESELKEAKGAATAEAAAAATAAKLLLLLLLLQQLLQLL